MIQAESAIGDYRRFIETIADDLAEAGVDPRWLGRMDHLAYRVETADQYRTMRSALAEIGTLVSEAEYGGRPIALFELHAPLEAAGFTVTHVELPAPKEGTSYRTGLEHAEIIVDDLERLMQANPSLSFDTTHLREGRNPRVSTDLARTHVKFHLRPLSEVVELEHADKCANLYEK